MKSYTLILLVFTLQCYSQTQVKEKEKENIKFGINADIGFGNGTLSHSNYGEVSGNTISVIDKFSCHLSEKINLSTGFGIVAFKGNVMSNGMHANLSNEYLQIPLYISFKSPKFEGFSENIRYVLGLGLYGNYLYASNLSYVNSNVKDENIGWNFGVNASVGMNFKIRPKSSISLLLDGSKDITNIEKNGVTQRLNYIIGGKVNISYLF